MARKKSKASLARRGQKVLVAQDTRIRIITKESKTKKRLSNKKRKALYDSSDEWIMRFPFEGYKNIGKGTKSILSWGLKKRRRK